MTFAKAVGYLLSDFLEYLQFNAQDDLPEDVYQMITPLLDSKFEGGNVTAPNEFQDNKHEVDFELILNDDRKFRITVRQMK